MTVDRKKSRFWVPAFVFSGLSQNFSVTPQRRLDISVKREPEIVKEHLQIRPGNASETFVEIRYPVDI